MQETILKTDENDDDLVTYEVFQHESSILPPLSDPSRIASIEQRLNSYQSQTVQLSHSIFKISKVLQVNNELTSKRLVISESKMKKEKDRTHKYHPSVVKLLTNLASVDGIDPAEAQSDSILRILNCESHSKAELESTT